MAVDCSDGFGGGGCCVFCDWWLWVMVLIWFLFHDVAQKISRLNAPGFNGLEVV